MKDLNKFKRFNTVVVIGMGGSILGAEAIYHFFKKKIKKEFLFLNNIDEEKLKEIKDKKKDYLEFIFDIQIKDLKNFTNLISEIKLKDYDFKIIRHRNKDAFFQRIFKNFKRY